MKSLLVVVVVVVALHISSSFILQVFSTPKPFKSILCFHVIWKLIQSHTLNWEEAKFNSDEVILIKVKAPPSGGDVWHGFFEEGRKVGFFWGGSESVSLRPRKQKFNAFFPMLVSQGEMRPWIKTRLVFNRRRDRLGCWAEKTMRQKMLFLQNIPKVFLEYIVGIHV